MIDHKDIIAKVRKVEIRTRRIVDELTGGAYHSVFKGRGMEFSEVREYQEGDDVRDIDWNVTARMGEPFIKQYVEERELNVQLLVDISASGDFGSGRQRKSEQAAELAALLAFSAIRNNDQVGLLLFSDQDELHLPQRKGRKHVLRLVRELLAHERNHRGTNIKAALEKTQRVLNKRSVIFIVSDFMDDGYEQALKVLSKRHDVIALHITDAHEQELPSMGLVNIEDAESGESMVLPSFLSAVRNRFSQRRGSALSKTESICRSAGVDLIRFQTGEDYVRPLMDFFNKRTRRR